jgi:hypothetical protein
MEICETQIIGTAIANVGGSPGKTRGEVKT